MTLSNINISEMSRDRRLKRNGVKETESGTQKTDFFLLSHNTFLKMTEKTR